MASEKTEHEVDIEFGQWLRNRREAVGLNLVDAATRCGLNHERLKAIELGYAEKSVTQAEAKKIASAYKLDLQDVLSHALGGGV